VNDMELDMQPASAGQDATQRKLLQPQDIHVLLVDDELLSRRIVGSLLRSCSYAVTVAESGMQALSMLQRSVPGTFQLVLTVRGGCGLVCGRTPEPTGGQGGRAKQHHRCLRATRRHKRHQMPASHARRT
jgi:hypothetical protein